MAIYQKIFASKYDAFMTSLERDFYPVRKKLLSNLTGQILDVGSGTGVNFEHFNSNAHVIAIEPSAHMLEKALEKIPAQANITTYNIGATDDLLDDIIEVNSLDFIVCTLVLCTIPDQKLALLKFKKFLKPTGKLIILEHIHAEKKVARMLYNIISPVWKAVGDGCNLNRDTDIHIKNAGFTLESEHYFHKGIRFYQAVFTV